MSRKRKRRGITPWKKTALKVCVVWLIAAAWIHFFREWKILGFDDQREASRWGSAENCAQVSAFLPTDKALREDNIQELEYKIHSGLAQDSIKLTSEGKDAKLWQDCYSGIGNLTISAGGKSVSVEAVGTGGAFFTFHPLQLSSGTYYLPDSVMKDEILLDQETAWKLFGAFDVTGRTVQVQDMHLRIAGVYKKGEGTLYKEGGLSDYVVFVQYKTLLQYGGNAGSTGGDGQAVPATASRPSTADVFAGTAEDASMYGVFARATEGPAGAVDVSEESEAPAEAESASDSQTDENENSAAANQEQESAAGSQTQEGAASRSGDSKENGQGTETGDEQNMENVGTANTRYKDTGMITTYEIVMPNPVDGYAAAAVKKALGEDSGAIVVDNTNRFGIPSLAEDLRTFAFLGMRTRSVRYPYWENVAMGWETIFAALFLLECILIALTILLLLWMLIHWYTHRSWTLATRVQSLQDSVYEKQSRKRYPEYYKEREAQSGDSESVNASAAAGKKTPGAKTASETEQNTYNNPNDNKEKSMLEDKGSIPFERIPENRKAVQYETKHQDDQRADGSSARSDHDSVR